MTMVVRSNNDPTALTSSIRQQLRTIDPELPLYSVQTLTERMSHSVADRRTPMMIAILFAVVALFLAAVGIYGVLAYQVSQRRREIAIRLALGSDGRTIFGLIVKEGMSLMVAGLVVGLAGAFAIRRTLETQLYGVGALDPMVLASVGVMLAFGVAVGLAGAYAIRTAMATQLYGVQPMDPKVLALVTAVLGAVAFLACAVPARRAARIDPLVALTDQ